MTGINNINRRSIWICDRDSMYLNMLQGYLKERIGLPLGFADFTDVKYLCDKPDNEEVLLLIIAEELFPLIDRNDFMEVLILTEEGGSLKIDETDRHIFTISRYSKAAELLDAVLTVISENSRMKELCLARDLPVHIIGFYSPLGRCLQTGTALTMGELLAENGNTVYMNFAPFPEERLVNLGQGENLADLIYYYGCDPESLKSRIFRAFADVGGLKVIPPAPSYMQVADVGVSEWLGFIREVCNVSSCQYLVLDLSEALPCLFELLDICETIYTICGRDKADAAKMISYRKYLSVRDQSKLMEKTVFMELPVNLHLPGRLGELQTSPLGEFLIQTGILSESRTGYGMR